MMKKEDYLKLLRDNPIFQKVLSMSSSEEEKRAIKAYTEDFMMKFFKDVYEPALKSKINESDSLKNTIKEIEKDIVKKDESQQENSE